MLYRCADESGMDLEIDADSAHEAAREYVEGGDWHDSGCTTFHEICVWDEDDDLSHVTITVEPEEPPCQPDGRRGEIREAHEWRETFLRGNGGGVLVTEQCSCCGIQRITDTWATNPTNGTQGHTSICYQDSDGELIES